jgi:Transposase, Mutator family
MTEDLGYEKREPAGRGSGDSRNGTSDKTLKTESGEMPIDVLQGRNGTFEPQFVKKHQTHFDGVDEKIISMSLDETDLEMERRLQSVRRAFRRAPSDPKDEEMAFRLCGTGDCRRFHRPAANDPKGKRLPFRNEAGRRVPATCCAGSIASGRLTQTYGQSPARDHQRILLNG